MAKHEARFSMAWEARRAMAGRAGSLAIYSAPLATSLNKVLHAHGSIELGSVVKQSDDELGSSLSFSLKKSSSLDRAV